jgi:hypothetical protein
MARGETILAFVRRRLDEGVSPPEAIWREAQAAFPSKCVSWGYVAQIRRDWIDANIARQRLAELGADHR